ncbi:MAG: hypothetical protein R3E60_00750 [Alphaproteobacteria bacterium]
MSRFLKNKGEIMGCSNPHPHGQIWAQASVPQEVAKKIGSSTALLGTNRAQPVGRLPGAGIGGAGTHHL